MRATFRKTGIAAVTAIAVAAALITLPSAASAHWHDGGWYGSGWNDCWHGGWYRGWHRGLFGWGFGTYPHGAYYYPVTYYYGTPSEGAVAYCMRRFRSYDPRSGTYLGYDGYGHPCP